MRGRGSSDASSVPHIQQTICMGEITGLDLGLPSPYSTDCLHGVMTGCSWTAGGRVMRPEATKLNTFL